MKETENEKDSYSKKEKIFWWVAWIVSIAFWTWEIYVYGPPAAN